MHRAQQRRNPTGRVTEAKATSAAGGQGSGRKRDKTLSEIERINRGREQRRQRISAARDQRARAERRNQQLGREQDVDFQRMVRSWRADREDMAMPHERRDGKELKICVAVRKRPISEREVRRKEFDSISCLNPRVVVHDAKLRVDGITKYLDNQEFAFDHTFHEDDTTEQVYDATARPLIPFVVERQGRATCFAYGQTGSGKTYTMQGIQDFAAEDLFNAVHRSEEPLVVGVSFFEIYGARVQDLLKGRQRLAVREDGKGEVVISGLEEVHTESAQELSDLIETGNRNRTTHATECNDTSSRSHAVCQINVRRAATGKLHGKLSLVDLAGSERAGDTKSNNRQRRLEGAEINKSLLALKECVRALDGGSTHVPYRASKLTMVLKDSFATGSKARTVMIATVSPGNTSSDHSINTLRYADRIKEQNVMSTLHYHHPPASAPPPPSHAADAKAADAKKTPRSKHAAPRADAAAAARSPAPAHGAAAEKDKEAPPSPAARGRGDGAAAEDKARARGAAADRAARKAAAPAAAGAAAAGGGAAAAGEAGHRVLAAQEQHGEERGGRHRVPRRDAAEGRRRRGGREHRDGPAQDRRRALRGGGGAAEHAHERDPGERRAAHGGGQAAQPHPVHGDRRLRHRRLRRAPRLDPHAQGGAHRPAAPQAHALPHHAQGGGGGLPQGAGAPLLAAEADRVRSGSGPGGGEGEWRRGGGGAGEGRRTTEISLRRTVPTPPHPPRRPVHQPQMRKVQSDAAEMRSALVGEKSTACTASS